MSKLDFTATGAAGIAAAVPLMNLLGEKFKQDPSKKTTADVSTMGLFLGGWVVLMLGLMKPPPGTGDFVSDQWKKRQTILSALGGVVVVGGFAMVKFKDKIKIPMSVGASVYVLGWALVAAAIVYSDPDYSHMATSEQTGRVIQSVAASMVVVAGTVMLSQKTNRLITIMSVITFVVGWVDVVAVSCLQ